MESTKGVPIYLSITNSYLLVDIIAIMYKSIKSTTRSLWRIINYALLAPITLYPCIIATTIHDISGAWWFAMGLTIVAPIFPIYVLLVQLSHSLYLCIFPQNNALKNLKRVWKILLISSIICLIAGTAFFEELVNKGTILSALTYALMVTLIPHWLPIWLVWLLLYFSQDLMFHIICKLKKSLKYRTTDKEVH